MVRSNIPIPSIDKIIKQHRVDSGQIGGILSIFTQSMFIFGIVTFLNTSALVYQSILKYYIPLHLFIIIIGIGFLGWMAIYYSIIMPSMIQFGNRQGYAHGNPMREDINTIKKDLGEAIDTINEMKEDINITTKNLKEMKDAIDNLRKQLYGIMQTKNRR